MNKKELIDELHMRINRPSDQPAVTKSAIERVLDAQAEVMHAHLSARGAELSLPGIGKFAAKHRDPRTGRNPQTGAPVEIPARRVPTFSASKALKDAVQA